MDTEYMETSADDLIDYMSMPSLKYIAMTRIAALVLAQSDVMNKLDEIVEECRDTFKPIKPIAVRKLRTLPIPNKLILELRYVISPMIEELYNWYNHTDHCERYDVPVKNAVHWTVYGTVDEARTFEMTVLGFPEARVRENAMLFYKKACRYCLEELLRRLWGMLSDSEKLLNCQTKLLNSYFYIDDFLKLYWVHFNDEGMVSSAMLNEYHYDRVKDKGKSVHRRAFHCSITSAPAFRYFWTKKLTPHERSVVLLEYSERSHENERVIYGNLRNDSFLFLLSQYATKYDQSKALIYHRYPLMAVLFRQSYWRRFLLSTLRVMSCQLKKDPRFESVLTHLMFDLFVDDNSDTILFKEIWSETTKNIKAYFVQNIKFSDKTANKILQADDVNTLIMILEEIPSRAERLKIILTALSREENVLKKYIRDVAALQRLIASASSGTSGNVNFLKNNISVIVRRSSVDIFYDRTGLHYDTSFEMFLDWCFVNKHEVRLFKVALPRRSDYKMIEKFMTGRDRADWTAFRKFLDWCFRDEESRNDFDEFKRCISRHNFMYRLVYRSLEKHNVTYADNLLDLAFTGTASMSKIDMIRSFKNEFLLTLNGMCVLLKCLPTFAVQLDDALETQYEWKVFERLVRWGAPMESCVISVLEKMFCRGNNQHVDEKIKRLLRDCANKTDDENAFEARQRYVAENSISPSTSNLLSNCYR